MIIWIFLSILVLVAVLAWNRKSDGLPRGSEDSFGRERVAIPINVFEGQTQYDANQMVFSDKVEFGGQIEHDPDSASMILSTTTQAGSLALRQSKRYFRYHPGKSQFIVLSMMPTTPKYNVYQEYGYGDDQNGVFFVISEEMAFVRRSSVSGDVKEERIAQKDWNMDTLDGKGPSGRTLDLEQSQILVIDLNWLGVGLVRVGFNLDGQVFFCHGFTHANKGKSTYMTTANLPIRWKLYNKGATLEETSVQAISTSICSDIGVFDQTSFPFTAANGTDQAISVEEVETPVFAIRPALQFKGQPNRVEITPTVFENLSTVSSILVRIYYNPVIVGGVWEAVHDESAMEMNTQPVSFSGGLVVAETFVPGFGTSSTIRPSSGTDQLLSNLPLTLDMDGLNPDRLLVTAQGLPGCDPTEVMSIISWREQR